MRRDPELVRAILFAVEAAPAGEKLRHLPEFPGYSPEELAGHVRLMNDAGLFDGEVSLTGARAIHMRLHGLSNAGHDLLDNIRSETVWAKTVEAVKDLGGSLSIGLMAAFAKAKAKEILGIDVE